MSTYFATAQEILDVISIVRPFFTITNVHASWHKLANTNVNRKLRTGGIRPVDATDIDDYLKEAEIAFYMEMAVMNREVETSYGEVMSESMGRYNKEYAKGMAMMFRATASPDSYDRMLPHESWRMLAQNLLEAYCVAYLQDNTTDHRSTSKPRVAVARGADWATVDDQVFPWWFESTQVEDLDYVNRVRQMRAGHDQLG